MGSFFKSKLKMFVLYGLVFMAFGAYVQYQETYVYGTWADVQGEVIALKRYYEKDKRGKNKAVFDLTVSYTYEGKKNSVERVAFSGNPKFEKGDPYPVKVNPENPDEVRVANGSASTLFFVAYAVGGLFFLIGMLAFLLDRKKPQRL